jgi:alanyl-tRNA synthetase
VRRIEALTGPAAIDRFRERSELLERTAELLGAPDDPLGAAGRLSERISELEQLEAEQDAVAAGDRADQLIADAELIGGVAVAVGSLGEIADQRAMLEIADRVRQKLGSAAVLLGGAADGKVALVASFADAATERGLSAAAVVKEAAAVVGGGGGGRENVAQAGGRDPEKLDEALARARAAITAGLG